MAAVLPRPFKAPRFSPALAGLCDALASRAALAGGSRLSFLFEPLAVEWPVAAVFNVEAGGFAFRLEFASLDFLAAYPELADVATVERLPEGLRLGIIEQLLATELDWLENALNATIVPLEAAPSAWLSTSFAFALDFAAANGRTWRVPLRLRMVSEDGAEWLKGRVLAALPQACRHPGRDGWPLLVTFIAGAMRLPPGMLSTLAAGDVLLPPEYPAVSGQVFLALPGQGGFRLAVAQGRAVVQEFVHQFFQEGAGVSDTENQTKEAAVTEVDAMEVEIHFELEKKILSLSEVESLAPGRSFAFGADPLSAVKVTLNGRTLAYGRLVELGGVTGVQITRLTSAAGG
ncbi:MAG: type III secretion system cytoplasmic ring protein SctQ [Zoogloeaceae bacterium]|jgi:type III secretion protein Q|nr:type III secretion system cytoplasmic ring protein SctQ [Zoogloeaceae bacterium]